MKCVCMMDGFDHLMNTSEGVVWQTLNYFKEKGYARECERYLQEYWKDAKVSVLRFSMWLMCHTGDILYALDATA